MLNLRTGRGRASLKVLACAAAAIGGGAAAVAAAQAPAGAPAAPQELACGNVITINGATLSCSGNGADQVSVQWVRRKKQLDVAVRRKLPGRMKFGAITVAPNAPSSTGVAGTAMVGVATLDGGAAGVPDNTVTVTVADLDGDGALDVARGGSAAVPVQDTAAFRFAFQKPLTP